MRLAGDTIAPCAVRALIIREEFFYCYYYEGRTLIIIIVYAMGPHMAPACDNHGGGGAGVGFFSLNMDSLEIICIIPLMYSHKLDDISIILFSLSSVTAH